MEKHLSQIEKRQEALVARIPSNDSGSDGDDVPIVQTVRRQQDGESWSDGDDIPIVQTVRRQQDVEKALDLPTMESLGKDQEREKDDCAISSSRRKPSNKHTDVVGKKVAKDFGKQGGFFGEVQSVEYDSDDAEHEALQGYFLNSWIKHE
jgi:hypothetical protein